MRPLRRARDRRLRAVLALLTLALGLMACGGGDRGDLVAVGSVGEERARRRILLALANQLDQTGRPIGGVRAHRRALLWPVRFAPNTAPQADLRTWPGPPLPAGAPFRCVVLPFDEMDRYVPGWSSATTRTAWQSGSEIVRITFHDATTPGQGCTAPSG